MPLALMNHSLLESEFDPLQTAPGIAFIEKAGKLLHFVFRGDKVEVIVSGYARRCRDAMRILQHYPLFKTSRVRYDVILGGLESYATKNGHKVAILDKGEEVIQENCVRWVDRSPEFFDFWKFLEFEVIKRYKATDIVCICTRQFLLAAGLKDIYPSSVWLVEMEARELVPLMEDGELTLYGQIITKRR